MNKFRNAVENVQSRFGVPLTLRCSCGTIMELEVCRSNAGYYLGFECQCSGPYSRETDYFRTHDEAQLFLEKYRDSVQN
jgi:hypothetical protein